eukprot:TRINITY_DN2714_c0_g1_i1.p1 TRINITY_DN2714_c0_g1~~TRINITY_DN2714_c0_g1_i1.p1  ORF type:complete len:1276 (+),score=452.37 TRINITY_DN2714_c0_g1_i1:76-3903(+)
MLQAAWLALLTAAGAPSASPTAEPSGTPTVGPSAEPLPVPGAVDASERLSKLVGQTAGGVPALALVLHPPDDTAGCVQATGLGFEPGDLHCALLVNASNASLPAGFEAQLRADAAWVLQVKEDQIVRQSVAFPSSPQRGWVTQSAAEFHPPLAVAGMRVVSTTVWVQPAPVATPDELDPHRCKCPDFHEFWHGKNEEQHGPLYCQLDGDTCQLHVVCENLGEHSEQNHSEPPYEIVFMFLSFVLGSLVRYSFSAPPLNKLPYTIVLFVFGLAIGFICKARGGAAMKLVGIADIDPHLIFHVFLPILIFESAFSMDWYVFKKTLSHCLLLAGPGILVATSLTAVLVRVFFTSSGYGEYEWNWVACFLYGATISATDPVAVVALLKELGGPPSTSALIEGESLFNDGTAIVLFNLLQKSVATGHVDKNFGEILWNLLYVACGGPVVGLVVGRVTEMFLSRVFNDALLEITITLCSAYITFFVAEGFLRVSGVLALVVLGVWLSHHRQCISPEVEHSLHSFWETTVYLANTLIFVLVGLVGSLRGYAYITPSDFGYLLLGYAIITVVRGVVILMFFKPMQLFEWKLERKPAVLVWWGGLRGAVGLALALIVAADESILCANRKLGDQFLFHVVGIVSLTLVVNGVSTQFVVASLGLSDIPEEKRKILSNCFDQMMESQRDKILELKTHHVLSDANWQIVRRCTHDGMTNPYKTAIDAFSAPTSQTLLNPEKGAQVAYLKVIKTSVWEQYEHGTIDGETILRVLRFIDVASAIPGCLLTADLLSKYWDESAVASRVGGLALSMPRFVGDRLSELAAKWKEQRWAAGFEVATALVKAHDDVIAKIDGLVADIKVANVIKDHCKRVKVQCFNQVHDLANERIEIAVSIQTRHAAREVLNSARSEIRKMVRDGLLAQEDAAELVKAVEKRMDRLGTAKTQMPALELDEVLQEEVPWMSTVESTAASELKLSGRMYMLRKNERLYDRDNAVEGVWIVVSGVARVRIPSWPPGESPRYKPVRGAIAPALLCGNGDTVGLGNVMCNEPRVCDVYAETDMRVVWYTADAIAGLTPRCPRLEHELWNEVGFETALFVLHNVKPYCDWPVLRLRKFARLGKALPPEATSRTVNLQGGTIHIMVRGSVCLHDDGDGVEISTPQVINTDGELVNVTIRAGAVVVSINNPTSAQAKARRNWSKIRDKLQGIRKLTVFLGAAGTREVIHQHFGEPLTAPRQAPDGSPIAVTSLRKGLFLDSDAHGPQQGWGDGLNVPLLGSGPQWSEEMQYR